MKNPYQWGLNKPHHIRTIAFDLARFSNEYQEMLSSVKQNNLSNSFPDPDPTSWFRLYYKSKYLKKFVVLNLLALDPASTNSLINTSKSYQDNDNLIDLKVKRLQNRVWQEHISHSFRKIIEPLDPKTSDVARTAVISTEFHFILQVAMPCWFFYHESHSKLFRKASKGDADSIEKLLRLDKMLIRNTSINRWLPHHSTKKNRLEYEKICLGLQESPKGSIDIQTVKSCFAGLISSYTEKLGHRLRAPSIQELFDCIARTEDNDALRDEDLPDAPESFSKLIQRYRKLWSELLR